MNEKKLRENIKKERESLGWKAVDLAEKIGVLPQKIYDIESGKVQIKYDFLLKVKEVLPNLKTGFEPLNTNIVGSVITSIPKIGASNSIVEQSEPDKDLSYVSEYEQCLSAGLGVYPNDHALAIGSRPFSRAWLQKKGLKPQDLKLLRVTGDSMEPLLKDKDMVLIDTSKIVPSESMPFAVRLENELLVKSIQRIGNQKYVLISRNKAYNDIHIDGNSPPADFAVIGAVVWHAHSWV